MREILFRGRGIEPRYWYEGELINTKGFIPPYMPMILEPDEKSDGRAYDVDPCTVGQFTGLLDLNGKKVFEGDILKIAKRSDSGGGYYHPPIDYPVNVVVKWDHCGWMWETLCEDKRYIGFPEAWGHYLCEVIGNIFDSQELVRGTAYE